MISSILCVWRILSFNRYLLVLVTATLFLSTILINEGFIDSTYTLPDYIVYPKQSITPHYIVLSSYSLAPFTSIFDTGKIEDKLIKVGGVNRTVYEVLAIVRYDSSNIIIRGLRRNDLRVVAGEYEFIGGGFNDNCTNCVWVGISLAQRLGISVNDTIIVYSPFTSSDHILVVKGIINTEGPLRYEFLTTLDTARTIRGSGPNTASIAIVFLNNREDMYRVAELFNIPASKTSLLEKALLALRYSGGEISARTYENLGNMFLSRLGLSRNLLFALLLAITLLLSLGFYFLGQSLITHDLDRLTILYEQGLPAYKIKLFITLYTLLYLSLAGLVVAIVSEALFPLIRFNILGYERSLVFDGEFLVYSLIINAALIIAGIWSVKIYGEQ
ncbi:hypothetical protein [Staphylothermus hellenicus]|uniref:MacB-like periplasmic core domain-containing protein n=1 Tax=Staphylothermus hellenicus (strain DSM 12710 / JCM 10830 / BK20S6-10-b1 / P8) TaxID=591019 RepID=D7D876_STAHD|nr:hypothetical protein [Staphylothermus hellenicus]ADI31972.1 hypothetical protein Shell_0862 [Staphylothermus hellenicus DSM 12710]